MWYVIVEDDLGVPSIIGPFVNADEAAEFGREMDHQLGKEKTKIATINPVPEWWNNA